jgi:hypothetical protein
MNEVTQSSKERVFRAATRMESPEITAQASIDGDSYVMLERLLVSTGETMYFALHVDSARALRDWLTSALPSADETRVISQDRFDAIKQSPRQADVTDVEDLCDEIERLRSESAAAKAAEVQRNATGFTQRDDAVKEDRAYYDGARQAAAMAHQSLQALDEWIAGGCGSRVKASAPPELRPCKRCGSTPYATSTMGLGWGVECGPCGINIPFPPAATRELAVRDWNRENWPVSPKET